MTVSDITANCVSVIYEDDSYHTVKWAQVGELESAKRALAVRIFHQQSPGASPLPPSNEVYFAQGWGLISLHLRGANKELKVKHIGDSPNKADEFTFDNDATQGTRMLDLASRHAQVGSAMALIELLPSTEPNWQTRVSAAVARDDIGPCA